MSAQPFRNLSQKALTPRISSTSRCYHLSCSPSLYSFRNYSSKSISSQTTDTPCSKKRIIVAMTGATGAIIGINLLKKLQIMGVETHLVMSKWAEATIKYETEYSTADVCSLASYTYGNKELSAPISSGSFKTDGMIVVPCSMKTLAAIRVGLSEDLVSRAADVILKERRKLVMVVRETPLSDIHIENMLSLTRSGAVMFPPVPAFYTKPSSVQDIVDQSVGRILDMFNLDTGDFERWAGFKKK